MSDGWLSGFDRIPGVGSGSWASDDEDAPKIVWHTTEGGSIGGAVAAFTAHRSWPHLTVDPVRRRRVQHVSLLEAARALRNTSTPGQTNREARVFQIEVVATAHDPAKAPAGQTSVASLTGDELDWLGTHVLAPLAKATGTPLTTGVEFFGESCGFTLASETARQRMTTAVWDTYRGICGHQHVPENQHWDPGPLDVARILTAARNITSPTPPQPPKGPLMALTDDEQTELLDKIRDLHADYAVSVDDKAKPPNGNKRWQIGKIFLAATGRKG